MASAFEGRGSKVIKSPIGNLSGFTGIMNQKRTAYTLKNELTSRQFRFDFSSMGSNFLALAQRLIVVYLGMPGDTFRGSAVLRR